jgi:hypothetical protein
LQQLDGLLELRRHGQMLTKTELDALLHSERCGGEEKPTEATKSRRKALTIAARDEIDGRRGKADQSRKCSPR